MKIDIIPRDKQGKPHGYWEVYYDNGNLNFKGYFIHGKRYGYCEEYFDNGNLWIKGCYIHGKRHGYCEEYRSNGELYYKGNWIHGIKYGYWESCYGELRLTGYYYMDEEIHQTSKDKLLL